MTSRPPGEINSIPPDSVITIPSAAHRAPSRTRAADINSGGRRGTNVTDRGDVTVGAHNVLPVYEKADAPPEYVDLGKINGSTVHVQSV